MRILLFVTLCFLAGYLKAMILRNPSVGSSLSGAAPMPRSISVSRRLADSGRSISCQSIISKASCYDGFAEDPADDISETGKSSMKSFNSLSDLILYGYSSAEINSHSYLSSIRQDSEQQLRDNALESIEDASNKWALILKSQSQAKALADRDYMDILHSVVTYGHMLDPYTRHKLVLDVLIKARQLMRLRCQRCQLFLQEYRILYEMIQSIWYLHSLKVNNHKLICDALSTAYFFWSQNKDDEVFINASVDQLFVVLVREGDWDAVHALVNTFTNVPTRITMILNALTVTFHELDNDFEIAEDESEKEALLNFANKFYRSLTENTSVKLEWRDYGNMPSLYWVYPCSYDSEDVPWCGQLPVRLNMHFFNHDQQKYEVEPRLIPDIMKSLDSIPSTFPSFASSIDEQS